MPDPDSYTVGWICALKTEHVAARVFLDEEHQDPFDVHVGDNNAYLRGRIGEHNVVVVVLPEGEYGTSSAASVARDMMHTFCNIRICLMVGVGGGAPSKRHDIRLGDVVVSVPRDGKGGVLQYDFGKSIQGQRFKLTGYLNQPPTVLRTAIAQIRSQYESDGHSLEANINDMLQKKPRLKRAYGRPDPDSDRLYRPTVVHPTGDESCVDVCGDDPSKLVSREARTEYDDNPAIHYGLIASANRLMKNALVRDKLAAELDVLCFEMEAAGLMNHVPCLVVRGICDYADSHKNNIWQGYAAMVAAAYTKDLLHRIAPNKIRAEKKLSDTLSDLHAVTKQVLETTQRHHETAKENLDIMKTRLLNEEQERLQTCHQLFRLTDGSRDISYEWYKNRVKERIEGTCTWLLKHEYFQHWLTQESGTLLVTADPGCGKSVLAKYLIDHVLPRSATICYFFFQDSDQSTVRQAMCALLHQLFTHNPSLLDHAMQEYAKNGRALIDTTASLERIFQSVLQDRRAGTVVVVLDALDECAESEHANLARVLARLSDHKGPGKLKYILTSRPYRQILSRLQTQWKDVSLIRIPGEEESETISHEVDLVISHRVNQLPIREESQGYADGFTLQLKSHLVKRLQETTHRTYLWVYLVFDYLEQQDFRKTAKGIDEVLATLPKTVDEAYERILSRSKRDSMVRKALCVILAARQPLTVSEMNISVNIHDRARSVQDLDLEDDDDFKGRLRSWCGLFVTIEQGRVYFLHQTAREFLLTNVAPSIASPLNLHWRHSITIQQAYAVIAEACVLYLNLLNGNIAGDGHSVKRHAFFDYSAIWWATHLWDSELGADATIYHYALQICDKQSKGYSAWNNVYRRWIMTPPIRKIKFHGDNYLMEALSKKVKFPHDAHVPYIRRILDEGHKRAAIDKKFSFDGVGSPFFEPSERVEAAVAESLHEMSTISRSGVWRPPRVESIEKEQGGGTAMITSQLFYDADLSPLSKAAQSGQEGVVKQLLDQGANINADSSWTAPLSLAAQNGHETVVKLLLDYGASLDPEAFGRTPLSHAAENGHAAVVKVLLNGGANVHARDYEDLRILPFTGKPDRNSIRMINEKANCLAKTDEKHRRWAKENGTDGLASVLIKNGTNPKPTNGEYGQTPLIWAAKQRHAATVELLLQSGADIEAKDSTGRTALAWAATKGNEAIVKLLLEKGALLETRDSNCGQTPLVWAIDRGHEAVVKQLLGAGANIEVKDRAYGQTPLAWAFESGNEAVIRLLLEKGANVRTNTHFRTPLVWAAENGHADVVELLLQSGVDIEETVLFQTPLAWAAENGHERVVKLLLDNGANIEAAALFQTPLACAAGQGHDAVVELLLLRGAEVDAKTFGRTPLSYAAENGYVAAARLLLENGANCDAEDSELGQTPLAWAAKGSHIAMARLLLEAGANVETADNIGLTPQAMASRKGDEDMVMLLQNRRNEL